MRADAQRNRQQVLRAATEAFAAEGLSVPVHEIARRAGVGTGTVSRHFPTKESLYAAVLLDRMGQLSAHADSLAAEHDPGTAFFGLLTRLLEEAAVHKGLAEALTGSGFDIESAASSADVNVSDRLRTLLSGAQQAGAVDPTVTFAGLKALMAGCLTYDGPDPDQLADVVCRGLRPVEFGVRPVGRVESPLRERADAPRQGDEGAPDAWVVFDASVRDALADVQAGDELILISWFDRADRTLQKVHPRGDQSRPPTGVFSTRSPDRPNPLGLHRVTVLAADGLRLHVNNLEALDNTPIIDVKPVLGDLSER
ncbi:tRNA (N6-threonylcarbamoyladenosine(37)-N6)-methyltransferase TrmO [Kribbella sp. GL6]|uniref:tRNA (N6-threonylcarbamoyladenosine(37)-N6)-methyltransferase TrmO n=1 Tax=Kribbella sp. GL6 TaxID=3419765 RepID=UPI003D056DA7